MDEAVELERWQECWRRGFAPALSTRGLLRLWVMLEADSPDLLQGGTTVPPPFATVKDWPAEQVCPVGACAWGQGLTTVEQVHDYFGRICGRVDEAMREPAACRYFTVGWDEGEREPMRRELLVEVNLTLKERIGVSD